jgi:hypothetical protein
VKDARKVDREVLGVVTDNSVAPEDGDKKKKKKHQGKSDAGKLTVILQSATC